MITKVIQYLGEYVELNYFNAEITIQSLNSNLELTQDDSFLILNKILNECKFDDSTLDTQIFLLKSKLQELELVKVLRDNNYKSVKILNYMDDPF